MAKYERPPGHSLPDTILAPSRSLWFWWRVLPAPSACWWSSPAQLSSSSRSASTVRIHIKGGAESLLDQHRILVDDGGRRRLHSLHSRKHFRDLPFSWSSSFTTTTVLQTSEYQRRFCCWKTTSSMSTAPTRNIRLLPEESSPPELTSLSSPLHFAFSLHVFFSFSSFSLSFSFFAKTFGNSVIGWSLRLLYVVIYVWFVNCCIWQNRAILTEVGKAIITKIGI